MSRLPAIGTIQYNDVDFDTYLEGTVAPLTARMEYDRSGRVVSCVEYAISVRGVLAGNSTNEDMDVLRARLTQPGGYLRFVSRGLGTDLEVNKPGGRVWDVEWGPKPQEFTWKSLGGGGRAAEFTWRCTFKVPECPGRVPGTRYKFALKEVNYSYGVDLDRLGMAVLTYQGYAVIPQTRLAVGATKLQQTADSILEQVLPPCPLGFRREGQAHRVDESKNRLEFTVRYREMAQEPLPQGVIDCQASHTVQNEKEYSQNVWAATLRATYTLDKSRAKATALSHFVQLYGRRVSLAQQGAWAGGQPAPDTVIVTHWMMREPDIYGTQAAEFEVRYKFATSVARLVRTSGLWSSMTKAPWLNTWETWRASLLAPFGRALMPRGYYGLGLSPAEDVLVSLCRTDAVPVLVRQPPQQLIPSSDGPLPAGGPILPETSWLLFEFWLEWEEDDGVIEHTPLDDESGSPPEPAPPMKELAMIDMDRLTREYVEYEYAETKAGGKPKDWDVWLRERLGNSDPGPGPGVSTKIAPGKVGHGPRYTPGTLRVLQQGRPGLSLVLKGRAIRVGYPIDCPWVGAVGGVPVVRANRPGREYFNTGVIRNVLGVPVFGAVWRQRFVFPMAPTKPVAPPAPQYNWLFKPFPGIGV